MTIYTDFNAIVIIILDHYSNKANIFLEMASNEQADETQRMLGQFQMKMIDIQTSLRKSTTQVEGLKRDIHRSKLTDKEINTIDENTPMFISVGRMFVLNKKSDVCEQIENKIKLCENDIKKQEGTKSYLEKQLRECELQFKEKFSV
ncbi:unnamed protein product [Rotaria socialis]|uniref:Prefoldin subunit 1 n=2 Tax=Rotaria socialis TaxID=392032 RepID=A0A818K177_9BILA|nr:unnamed protein product [Rotaria socialis]CAF3343506.1 unnamed protein product [Rotaria socialis]CAF3554085.1 unnamed protein product [Rotaria socialis]CAF3557785.1 unnamed protein product [Rotaria socialis]